MELFPLDLDREEIFKEEISPELKEKYGVEYINIKDGENVYFIDSREIEEYEIFRIKGAFHLRAPDIESADDIIKTIGIEKTEFENSVIVIYCHDGHRGSEVASKINLPNVKFLIGGRKNFFEMDITFLEGDRDQAPFPTYIKDADFTVTLEEAKRLLFSGAFLVDGRLYENDYELESAYKFRIGQMSSDEYYEKLQKITDLKNQKILFVANIYPDLFYGKLLIYRLERDYGFNYNNFYILFAQDSELHNFLKSTE